MVVKSGRRPTGTDLHVHEDATKQIPEPNAYQAQGMSKQVKNKIVTTIS